MTESSRYAYEFEDGKCRFCGSLLTTPIQMDTFVCNECFVLLNGDDSPGRYDKVQEWIDKVNKWQTQRV